VALDLAIAPSTVDSAIRRVLIDVAYEAATARRALLDLIDAACGALAAGATLDQIDATLGELDIADVLAVLTEDSQ
jgi:hypothetical protein